MRIVAGYHVDASPCGIRSLPVSGISTVMLGSPSLDRSLSSLEVSTCSLVRAASLGDCRGVLFLLDFYYEYRDLKKLIFVIELY